MSQSFEPPSPEELREDELARGLTSSNTTARYHVRVDKTVAFNSLVVALSLPTAVAQPWEEPSDLHALACSPEKRGGNPFVGESWRKKQLNRFK